MHFFEVFDVEILIFGIDLALIRSDIFSFEFSFDKFSDDRSDQDQSNNNKQKRLLMDEGCHAISGILQ